MGMVVMSEKELNRIRVLTQLDEGKVSCANAANLLNLSVRQIYRLRNRFRNQGALGLRHKARGKRPNNQIPDGVRDYALALIEEHYADFGPTLATEMLEIHHQFKVSRETVRQWMMEDGIWLSKVQRRRFHQPRLRREAFGELIQIDGSDHRWFEERGDPCTLLVFVDDATSTLMQLQFVPSESAFSYFSALEHYLGKHGRPVAFYSDKHSVFKVANEQSKGGAGMTQFGRALSELNIEILCANSSQAKGRVERANRTLQDRLVKELRLADISDMEAGNAFLQGFTERFNNRFAKRAYRPDNLHRTLNVEPDRLADILCWRDKRHVTQQLAISYNRKRIMLRETEFSRSLVGKYVDTYEFADGRFEVRAKGAILPYTSFDKDQRVTHAAVTENKRLGEVLAFVKKEQEASPPRVKVKSASDKGGYEKRERKPRRARRSEGASRSRAESLAILEEFRKKHS
ncbi:ISNCY family transposase [Pseudovibrio sp. POLY-S9]|uniref:ISNCY family transposase n=1 Tax=Pseudovibrio sp. POLY-S9 TaxID=1576596 RepID=UPI00070F95DA